MVLKDTGEARMTITLEHDDRRKEGVFLGLALQGSAYMLRGSRKKPRKDKRIVKELMVKDASLSRRHAVITFSVKGV